MKRQTVIEQYKKWAKNNGLKKGQVVQVLETKSVFIVSKLGTVIFEKQEIIKK